MRPGVINVGVFTVGSNTPSSYEIEVSGESGGTSSTVGLNQATAFGVVSVEEGGTDYIVTLQMIDASGVVGASFPNCAVEIESTAGTIGPLEVRGIRVHVDIDVEVRFDVVCT